MSMRVFVSVPTYREAENIEELLTRLRVAVPDAHILVIDDGSDDGTADIAEKLAIELRDIEVLRRPGKSGLGAAYRAGHAIGLARGYDVMVQIDSDLSHQPEALRSLLDAVHDGADLAIGSRYVEGGAIPQWAVYRLALSRWGCRYAAWVLGIDVSDSTAGYRAYRASALRAMQFETTRANGYGFQIEMTYRLARAGGRITEVPITFTDRERGTSKMSGRIVVEAMILVTVWGLRDRLGRRRRNRS
ncbi:MAG: dolichol-phosphate mannosyltransferase [Actinomycetota bacterium]|jgi:dolichol-phosphate mannosyltransferase|nr:dolichol-phosphate mannosyltransferase [Actinomycetota bacterium]